MGFCKLCKEGRLQKLKSQVVNLLRVAILDEEYQTDQRRERQRFTDLYSKYFEDDENKADLFTGLNLLR